MDLDIDHDKLARFLIQRLPLDRHSFPLNDDIRLDRSSVRATTPLQRARIRPFVELGFMPSQLASGKDSPTEPL